MKKISVVFFSVIAMLFLLTGCQNDYLKNAVSEQVEGYYVGQNEHYGVKAISGHREINYRKDGIRNETIPFTSFVVTVLSEDVPEELKMNFDGKTYTLKKSPFQNTYSVTLKGLIESKTIETEILNGENSEKISLADKMIKNVDPLEILKKEFASELEEMYYDGTFDGEISIRYGEGKGETETYYWYVSVVKTDKSYFALMIRADSGEIVAKKA